MDREDVLDQYKKLARTNQKKKGFTKEEALNRIYPIRGMNAGGNKLQARISVPISLMNCKVKLVEVKDDVNVATGEGEGK